MPLVTVSATDTVVAGDFLAGGNPGMLETPGVFPLNLVATKDLLNYTNTFPSYTQPTLQSSILATDLSITLSTGSGAQFPTQTFEVSIDDEIIFVSSRSGDILTVIRGAESTTAALHTAGANVQLLMTALAHNQVVAELVNIENFLGKNGANISSTPLEVVIPSTTAGDFQLAHGLGKTPKYAVIQMTSNGLIRFQSTRYDNTYVYLNASDNGLTGYVQVFG